MDDEVDMLANNFTCVNFINWPLFSKPLLTIFTLITFLHNHLQLENCALTIFVRNCLKYNQGFIKFLSIWMKTVIHISWVSIDDKPYNWCSCCICDYYCQCSQQQSHCVLLCIGLIVCCYNILTDFDWIHVMWENNLKNESSIFLLIVFIWSVFWLALVIRDIYTNYCLFLNGKN